MLKQVIDKVMPVCSRHEAEIVGYGLACMTWGYACALIFTRR